MPSGELGTRDKEGMLGQWDPSFSVTMQSWRLPLLSSSHCHCSLGKVREGTVQAEVLFLCLSGCTYQSTTGSA